MSNREDPSACASCPTAGLCSRAGKLDPNIEIPASLGLKAVLLSYVAPLIVLLAGFFVSQALGAGELAAGLIGIGATAMYYFLLWLCRKKVRREYDSCFKEQLT
ncbi:MAG: SoxR reducing system RseC family protein [Bacteroidales bacterium]|nr:SoxR reducing system RseC family protein [Bacteroidales bacterium]